MLIDLEESDEVKPADSASRVLGNHDSGVERFVHCHT